MASRVFKIPDGDGGILYRVQTPDGRWHETDEKGNILPGEGGGAGDGTESPSGAAAPGPAIPKGRRKGKPSPAAKEGSHVNFSIHFTKEEYREFSEPTAPTPKPEVPKTGETEAKEADAPAVLYKVSVGLEGTAGQLAEIVAMLTDKYERYEFELLIRTKGDKSE